MLLVRTVDEVRTLLTEEQAAVVDDERRREDELRASIEEAHNLADMMRVSDLWDQVEASIAARKGLPPPTARQERQTGLVEIDTRIDAILDPLGPPGTQEREDARLGDAGIEALRVERNRIWRQPMEPPEVPAAEVFWELARIALDRATSSGDAHWQSNVHLAMARRLKSEGRPHHDNLRAALRYDLWQRLDQSDLGDGSDVRLRVSSHPDCDACSFDDGREFTLAHLLSSESPLPHPLCDWCVCAPI